MLEDLGLAVIKQDRWFRELWNSGICEITWFLENVFRVLWVSTLSFYWTWHVIRVDPPECGTRDPDDGDHIWKGSGESGVNFPVALRAYIWIIRQPMSFILYFIGLIDYREIIWLQTFGVCPFNISLWQNGVEKKEETYFSEQLSYSLLARSKIASALCSKNHYFLRRVCHKQTCLSVVLNREFLGKPNFGNLGVFLVLPYCCVHTFSFPHHWNSETSTAGSARELCDVDSPSSVQLFCNSSREENILFSRDMMVGTWTTPKMPAANLLFVTRFIN